jgi:hypothetical protein
MKMVTKKLVERTMIEILNVIQFEDFSSYVIVTTNKGNNDMATLWEFIVRVGCLDINRGKSQTSGLIANL